MKKTSVVIFLSLFIAVGSPIFSAEKDKKGASPKAYENASENAVFNRIGDWFVTVGKSKEEKTKILEERKVERTLKRIEKKAKKAKKQAEKETKKSQKKAEKTTEKIKKKGKWSDKNK